MPHPHRHDFFNTFHHVFNRGVNRQDIFLCDNDYAKFISLLDYIQEKHHIEIHGYCLMPNHYHLLVYTHYGNLSRAMYDLNRLYAIYFNKKEHRDGPLFRGRFKSTWVQDIYYLMVLLRYIHLNPVRAKLCAKPQDYEWSDYQNYTKNVNWFVSYNYRLLDIFQSRQINYEDYVNEAMPTYTQQANHAAQQPVS